MKRIIPVTALIIFLSAFLVPDDKATFKKLYALEGTWKMSTRRGYICEEWKRMDESHLQNRGYMIRGTDTLVTERVSLTRSETGIFYTSAVEDQDNKQPVSFQLTKSEGNRFVFENPQHDFPKRIVYNLITADSLHAFIDDGTATGKRQNFYYKKQ